MSNSIIYVGDEFRKNELSNKAGGSTVHAIYNDGSVRVYDKVKYPKKYIEYILANNTNVKTAYVV